MTDREEPVKEQGGLACLIGTGLVGAHRPYPLTLECPARPALRKDSRELARVRLLPRGSFDLRATLQSGQAFRWEPCEGGSGDRNGCEGIPREDHSSQPRGESPRLGFRGGRSEGPLPGAVAGRSGSGVSFEGVFHADSSSPPQEESSARAIFEGVIYGFFVRAWQDGDGAIGAEGFAISSPPGRAEEETGLVRSSSLEELLTAYFDVSTDYDALVENILRVDPALKEVVCGSAGLRILRQEPWETLVSFILSAHNNIPRIKRMVRHLCAAFGSPARWHGKTVYTFPTPPALADASVEDLRRLGLGFRARYVKKAARAVAAGYLDLAALAGLPTEAARKRLLALSGVGPKVADCVLLFSLGKTDVFPVDVWVKRALERLYFNGKPVPARALQDFAVRRFGDLSGLIQCYVYTWARARAPSWKHAGGP